VNHSCCDGFVAPPGEAVIVALVRAWALGHTDSDISLNLDENYPGSLAARDIATATHLGPLSQVRCHGSRRDAQIAADLITGVGLPAQLGDGSDVVTRLNPPVAHDVAVWWCDGDSCERINP
jgi:hypothetical protein